MHTPTSNTPVPAPKGVSRGEYIQRLMADGVTNLATAMTLADAAGKLGSMRLSHAQAYAIAQALTAARAALLATAAGAPAPSTAASACADIDSAIAVLASAHGDARLGTAGGR